MEVKEQSDCADISDSSDEEDFESSEDEETSNSVNWELKDDLYSLLELDMPSSGMDIPSDEYDELEEVSKETYRGGGDKEDDFDNKENRVERPKDETSRSNLWASNNFLLDLYQQYPRMRKTRISQIYTSRSLPDLSSLRPREVSQYDTVLPAFQANPICDTEDSGAQEKVISSNSLKSQNCDLEQEKSEAIAIIGEEGNGQEHSDPEMSVEDTVTHPEATETDKADGEDHVPQKRAKKSKFWKNLKKGLFPCVSPCMRPCIRKICKED